MGTTCPNHIKSELKKCKRVISHGDEEPMKSDTKFKEKLTCVFKHDMWNLVNFHPTTKKSEDFTLMESFCPKYMRFELKHTEELFFITLNSDAKFE